MKPPVIPPNEPNKGTTDSGKVFLLVSGITWIFFAGNLLAYGFTNFGFKADEGRWLEGVIGALVLPIPISLVAGAIAAFIAQKAV